MVSKLLRALIIFGPGIGGGSAVPVLYHVFGGRDIKQLIKKYGDKIKFSDLRIENGWKGTTPIMVRNSDLEEFGKKGKETIEEGLENDINDMKQWLKGNAVIDGISIGRNTDLKEFAKSKGEQNKALINCLKGGVRQRFDQGLEECRRSYEKRENGRVAEGMRELVYFDYRGEGIVWNWGAGYEEDGRLTSNARKFNKTMASCKLAKDKEMEKKLCALFKTSGLIGQFAMHIMDSTLRSTNGRFDVGMGFVDSEGRLKSVFGFDNSGFDECDFGFLKLSGEFVKGLKEKLKNGKTWGKFKENAKFGYDPATKKQEAFK